MRFWALMLVAVLTLALLGVAGCGKAGISSEIGRAGGFPWAAVIAGIAALLLVGLIVGLSRHRQKRPRGAKEGTCPVCGAPCGPADPFCLKCGARLSKE